MKKVLKIIVVVLFVALAGIQFIRPNFNNPQVVEAETLEASTEVPEDVGQILKTSCYDCHSNQTVYPWYSRISPVSWWLADHIREGRGELNFSVWNTYNNRRKAHKLEEICENIESKAMPLPSYLWGHGDAELSPEKIKILCDWANREKAKLESAAPPETEKK
ncbi:MAG: heme-binding domain-containing protein [Pyrinomonadaceae bacterium]